MKKGHLKYLSAFCIILSVLLLSSISSAVQVVEVAQGTPTTTTADSGNSWGIFGFLKSPIFWYFFIALILFALVCLGIFLLVRWAVKYIKQRNDLFYRLRQDRIALAKVHRRYSAPHWFKVHKNTPIKLVKIDSNGKPTISRTIAYHRGDYTTHEGNMFLWINLDGKKQYWFFPKSDLLVIPNKSEVKIIQRSDKGEKVSEQIFNMPMAKDIIQFNENEILLYAEGVDHTGIFLIPVLKSTDGKIINLALPTYASLKDVVMGDYLYEVNSEFVALSKQAMNYSPHVRAIQKVGDPNQNVQIEQTGK